PERRAFAPFSDATVAAALLAGGGGVVAPTAPATSTAFEPGGTLVGDPEDRAGGGATGYRVATVSTADGQWHRSAVRRYLSRSPTAHRY
ncbi:hypothetical protein, partial [Streptomyces sp. NPDC059455]|uniref:hypothetical protein n=1 Tax=Streptomyces sp. NPDC059455 TaxID=3346837 RepID=UPI0036D108EB